MYQQPGLTIPKIDSLVLLIVPKIILVLQVRDKDFIAGPPLLIQGLLLLSLLIRLLLGLSTLLDLLLRLHLLVGTGLRSLLFALLVFSMLARNGWLRFLTWNKLGSVGGLRREGARGYSRLGRDVAWVLVGRGLAGRLLCQHHFGLLDVNLEERGVRANGQVSDDVADDLQYLQV